MKHYQQYKDSGVEWIGEIPEHWATVKIKSLPNGDKDSFMDGDWIESPYITEFGIRYITTGNIGEGKFKEKGNSYISEKTFRELDCTEVYAGDLIISRLSLPVGRCCIIPDLGNRIVTSVDNVILRPKEGVLKKYLLHMMNTIRYFEFTSQLARGTTLQRISRSMLGNIKVILPPSSEQTTIANFLDYKTQLIDDLIAKKKRLIELLKEERTAMINQAVTKGLDPNVPMKDSGIEWLGEIPEHWEIKKIKYELQNFDHIRIPLSSEERGRMEIKIYDYYGASGIIDKVENYLFDGEYLLIGEDGANLLSRSSALAYKASGKFWVNNHAHILKPFKGNIDYFTCLLEQIDYTIYITGSAQPKLTQDRLAGIKMPVPPLFEQNNIMNHIQEKSSFIGKSITTYGSQIELLNEYKTSLINEAVTGKIDVRDFSKQNN